MQNAIRVCFSIVCVLLVAFLALAVYEREWIDYRMFGCRHDLSRSITVQNESTGLYFDIGGCTGHPGHPRFSEWFPPLDQWFNDQPPVMPSSGP